MREREGGGEKKNARREGRGVSGRREWGSRRAHRNGRNRVNGKALSPGGVIMRIMGRHGAGHSRGVPISFGQIRAPS